MTAPSDTGAPILAATRTAGEHVGEIGLLQRRPSTATVTARTESVLYRIEASRPFELSRPVPAVMDGFRLGMEERLSAMAVALAGEEGMDGP